ncbi:MAG: hypothetical protein KKA68_21170 [Gammaproteobacteria bacterium]|nr:hypothetical protein [Gammaproteobacteria bacterium]
MEPLNVWVGTEAEGRLTGIRTLFVGGNSNSELSSFETVAEPFVHIFFNPRFIMSHGYDLISSLVCSNKHYCTVCIYPDMLQFVPQIVLEKAHIMISVTIEGFEKLKQTDSLRVMCDDAFNNVVTNVGSFLMTDISIYDKDEPLEV